jgi:hypothetical protein
MLRKPRLYQSCSSEEEDERENGGEGESKTVDVNMFVLIFSQFSLLNFVLPSCKANFAEVSRTR